jgi:putative sterol carrier protein
MAAFADRDAAKGVIETYEYRIGGLVFHFTVDDGSIQLHQGQAQAPAATVTTDEETWADIASGKITGSSAAAAGALTLTGDPQAAARLRKIFSRSRVLAQAEATINGARQQGAGKGDRPIGRAVS